MDSLSHTRDDWILMFVAYCEKHGITPSNETPEQAAVRIFGAGTQPRITVRDGIQWLQSELSGDRA